MLMPVYLPLLPDPLYWINRAAATDLVESPLANGLPMRGLHLFFRLFLPRLKRLQLARWLPRQHFSKILQGQIHVNECARRIV